MHICVCIEGSGDTGAACNASCHAKEALAAREANFCCFKACSSIASAPATICLQAVKQACTGPNADRATVVSVDVLSDEAALQRFARTVDGLHGGVDYAFLASGAALRWHWLSRCCVSLFQILHTPCMRFTRALRRQASWQLACCALQLLLSHRSALRHPCDCLASATQQQAHCMPWGKIPELACRQQPKRSCRRDVARRGAAGPAAERGRQHCGRARAAAAHA